MSSFINNIIKLTSGSLVAQGLLVITTPIITRIYSPENFGTFQIFLSITIIFATISCFSYHLAIMLPEKDEDAISIVSLCILLVFISSILVGIIFSAFPNLVIDLFRSPELIEYIFYVPIAVLFNGIFFVLSYWISRKKYFGANATSNVINSVSRSALQIGTGMLNATPFGLIFGQFAGYFLGDIYLLKKLWHDVYAFKSSISIRNVKKMAIKYKRFPVYTSWSLTANSLSLQITPVLIALFFSTSVVGYYSIANIALNLPMMFVGLAISQVFFQKASEEKNRSGDIRAIVNGVHNRLIIIGIFPMLALILTGEEIFSFILGSNWAVAGIYAKILAPWILLVFISSPLSTIFSVLEKQNVDFMFNILILLSRVATLYIGGVIGSPYIALILFSATGVIFWTWMNFYILKSVGISPKGSIITFIKYCTISIAILSPAFIISNVYQNTLVLIGVILITSLLYYIIVIYKDDILKKYLLENIGVWRAYAKQ